MNILRSKNFQTLELATYTFAKHEQMKTTIFVSLLFATCLTAVHAEDWLEFRGPTGQGTTTATNIPTEWGPDSNVLWKKKIAGKGWSSPVVDGDRIYLTTAVPIGEEKVASESKFKKKVENAFSLRTVCLDKQTGDVIWNVEVFQVPPETGIHPKNSHASPTPLMHGDRIYVHFGTFGTAALDLSGKEIWKKTIEYKPVHGSGGSPVLFEDLLIFSCDGGEDPFVIALDANSGKERWKTQRQDFDGRTFSFSTPLLIEVDGTTTLVSAASDAVFGYDPKTGEQTWVVQYPDKWSIVPRPVFANGLILICTGYEGPAELLAIRPSGKGDVTDTHIAWREDKFVPHNPSPVVHENAVYLVSDSGIASCRDLATGKLHWKERLGDDHSASPFIAEGNIYFLSEEGACTVVKAMSSEYQELAKNDVKEQTLASMVPLDSGILLRTETQLYRIGK